MKYRSLLLSVATMVLMLGVVEIALHLLNYPASPAIGWRWDQSPYRAAINQDDRQVNQLGLRGRKIEYGNDDFVVVLVGDSQVEAGTQTADHLPEIILQEALQKQLGSAHIKVFSIASAGWGQDQEWIWLQKYFEKFRADLVLVWPTPVNDYWENTFIDRSVTTEAGKLKPSFRPSQNSVEAVLPAAFEWKLRALAGLAVGKASKGKQYTIEQFYSDRWLAALPSSQRGASSKAQCSGAEVLEKDLIESYLKGNRAYTAVTEEDVVNNRSHFSPFLKNASDRDRYSVAITHSLLQEIAKTAQAHGARFHLFHPYRNDLDASFREIQCVKIMPAGAYFEFDGSDWLRYLKQSPLSKELITLDIRSEHLINVAPGDWHLNYQGNREVMDALAQALIQRQSVAAGKPDNNPRPKPGP